MRENLYDVVVAGGGLGGAAAAISAAREGVSVALLERSSCLGGAATNGMNCEMNAGYCGERCMMPAVSREIFRRLERKGCAQRAGWKPMTSDPAHGCDRICFNPEAMKLVLEEMVLEAGVKLLYLADVSRVRRSGQEIRFDVNNKYETLTLAGRYLIDATGNSEAVYLMDPDCTIKTRQEARQGATTIFRLGNVDMDAYLGCQTPQSIRELIDRGVEEGALKYRILATAPIPGSDEIMVNITRCADVDFESVEDMTRAILETRAQIREALPFLRANMPGLRRASLTSVAASIGIRDRRQLDALYRLNGSDLIRCVRFSDSVAVGCYPIDIHREEGGRAVQFVEIGGDGIYSIPFRSMVCKKYPNVLAGCRGICSDDDAFAAFRTMPTVMGIGHAAGLAAAMAARSGADLRAMELSPLRGRLAGQDYPDCAELFQ